jgi:uncharacterized membrane protein (DUF373 family)
MLNWIIIIGLILLAFAFLRVKHLKHKVTAVLLILLILFLYTSFSSVISEKGINLKSSAGIESALRIYFNWLGHAFSNFKSLTGNAVKMEWNINQTAIK